MTTTQTSNFQPQVTFAEGSSPDSSFRYAEGKFDFPDADGQTRSRVMSASDCSGSIKAESYEGDWGGDNQMGDYLAIDDPSDRAAYDKAEAELERLLIAAVESL